MTSSHYILSFDVGIKNLAYCVLELKIPTEQKSEDTKESRFQIKWNAVTILRWGSLNILPSTVQKCNQVNVQKLTQNLFRILYKKHSMLTHNGCVQTVLIEQQPLRVGRMGNVRMNLIQQAVMDYYTLYQYPSMDIVVHPISPTYKLKCDISSAYIWAPKPTKPSTQRLKYAQRKKMAIEMTQQLIDKVSYDLGIPTPFFTQRKKDDYADCFLQAIYYIQNNPKLFWV